MEESGRKVGYIPLAVEVVRERGFWLTLNGVGKSGVCVFVVCGMCVCVYVCVRAHVCIEGRDINRANRVCIFYIPYIWGECRTLMWRRA